MISSVDPAVLFFLLGMVAGLLRSDLRLPSAIYEFLVVLLLLAIGLRGGVELSHQAFGPLLVHTIVVIGLGIVLTLIGFAVLRFAGGLKRADAAAVAAHYGSVSVGTFAVAVSFLMSQNVEYETHMPYFVVLMEVPAIVVGVMLARGMHRGTGWGRLAHETLLGKGVVLLTGGLLIGWATGERATASLDGLFFAPFQGVLALFLLEMGLLCSDQIGALRRYGAFLLAFAIGMPLFASSIGTVVGWSMGLTPGGTALLATLAGSASYIAVPAAMRLSVPESNPGLSLSASLGVTFPFNVALGIPLYLEMARWIHGVEI